MEILLSILVSIIFFMVIAHAPILPIIRVIQHDIPDKLKIIKCFIEAYFKTLIVLPFDLLSPIIVAIALLFTKWENDKLPKLFWMWDNDASINGDVRTDDPADGNQGWNLKTVPVENIPEAVDMCYWAKGHHPRSFYARWVWLGLRNRASALSEYMGTSISGDLEITKEANWSLHRISNTYRYYEIIPIGSFVIRVHCGYKIPKIPGELKAPVVSIGFSLKKIK